VAYYSFLFVIRDTRGMPSVFVQLLEYAMVAAGGTGLLALFHFFLPLNFEASVFFSIGVLSFLNILLVRVSPLGSARLAHVEYRDMPGTFYDDQTDFTQVGRFRAWFHVSRFQKLKRFVATYYKPGMQIADLGCGNCWWNTDQWPVTGVDTNWRMVSWALQHGRLQAYRISDDLAATRLPDKSFDVVVMSETLEHLFNLKDVLREVRRILKDDGHFLITIPYDIFLGPFFVLFNLNCVYQGYVKGSKYHRYRCGHIHHFSVRRLRSALAEVGLRLEKFHIVNGLTLFARAVKSQVQPITNSSLVRPR
jgi:SAM-dependent methyltransferase